MTSVNKSYLRISITSAELVKKASYNPERLYCFILLNDEPIDKFNIGDPNHQISIPLTDGTDKIRVILQLKESKDIIGCISFLSQTFFPFKGQTFTQW